MSIQSTISDAIWKSQNRKRSSQGRLTKKQVFLIYEALSQNRKRSSQGRVTKKQVFLIYEALSQNRKRSSQGRGQARKPALQAAEKGIFEKQTNVFLPHK